MFLSEVFPLFFRTTSNAARGASKPGVGKLMEGLILINNIAYQLLTLASYLKIMYHAQGSNRFSLFDVRKIKRSQRQDVSCIEMTRGHFFPLPHICLALRDWLPSYLLTFRLIPIRQTSLVSTFNFLHMIIEP